MTLITYGENRVFVDIAYSGCGSGCKYCYVSTAKEGQKLITEKSKKDIVETLLSIADLKNKIVSFSPNTEPFKSDESVKLVIDIVRQIIQSGVSIQISTKEKIKCEYIKLLNDLCVRQGQIVINVSVPVLTDYDKIEPGAADIEDRLENFRAIHNYDKIKGCLYIKPFTVSYSYNYLNNYISIINQYDIEYVCVGMVFYKNNLIDTCRSYYNDKIMNDTIQKNDIDKMQQFAEEIRSKTSAVVVFSTTCIFVNLSFCKCSAKFYQYKPFLCKNCQFRED